MVKISERKRSPIECYHPKYAVFDGINPSGKKHLSFLGSNEYEKILADKYIDKENLVTIPCGKCVGCRLRYSMQWANRLLLELTQHDPSTCFFVTLTYDNEHITRCRQARDEKGNIVDGLWSLEKRDLQLFMKRLRKKLTAHYCTTEGEFIKVSDYDPLVYSSLIEYQKGKNKGNAKEFYFTEDAIRFYACGEYGSKNYRCHFHLILFNMHLPSGDLHFLKKSKLGYDYQTSDLLSEVWPYGFNVVAPVTWQSCSYTARYMMKKQKGDNALVYSDYGIEAPFSVCSRKPGIGKAYFDAMEDFGEVSSISIGTGDGVRKFAPPAYFERLFAEDFPEEAQHRSDERRRNAMNRTEIVMSHTDLNRSEYLENLERNLTKATDSLYYFRDL